MILDPCTTRRGVLLPFAAGVCLTLGLPACGESGRTPGDDVLVPFEEVFRLQDEVQLRTAPDDPIGRGVHLVRWGGRFVLVDMIQANVKVFDPTGRLVATLGGPGDGPGEFRMPVRAVALPDGRLAVLDQRHSAISFFDAAGTFEKSWTIPGQPVSEIEVVEDGSKLLVVTQLYARDTDDWSIDSSRLGAHLFTIDGELISSFYPVPEPVHQGEGSFQVLSGARMGSTVLIGLMTNNRIYHRNLSNGDEWWAEIGHSVYRSPDWKSAERVASMTQAVDWASSQLWLYALKTLDENLYLAEFTEPNADGFHYAVANLQGETIATTQLATYKIHQAVDELVYATRTDDDGEMYLARFRLQLPAR